MAPDLREHGTRTRAQQSAYVVGAALYLLAIFFSLWLSFFYGVGPAGIPVLGAIAMPLFAVVLAVTLPTLYSVVPKPANANHSRVGWVFVVPGYSLSSTAAEQLELVFWPVLLVPAIAGGLVLAFVICRRLKTAFFVVALLTSSYVAGALAFINCMYDHSPPLDVIAIEEPEQKTGKRNHTSSLVVELGAARPHGMDKVRLGSDYNSGYRAGICFRMYRGALFLAWYTVDQYSDCPVSKKSSYRPGVDQRLDDVMATMSKACTMKIASACLIVARIKAGTYTADELVTEWADMACARGDRSQCEILCSRDKKRIHCIHRDASASAGPHWSVSHATTGVGPDGRYQGHVVIFCAAPQQPGLTPKPTPQTLVFDGEHYRDPVAKRLHKTVGEAANAVCGEPPAAPAYSGVRPHVEQPPAAPAHPSVRPYVEQPTTEERAAPTAAGNAVYKCKGEDGKTTLTDTPCP
ncbi:MAG: DUF4124 domain-containing protein [Pseudomonadota bacterium]